MSIIPKKPSYWLYFLGNRIYARTIIFIQQINVHSKTFAKLQKEGIMIKRIVKNMKNVEH